MANLLKTEDHHWWPQAVARLWMNADGVVHQLFPDGRVVKQINTKKFGHIKNAHLIKLHNDPAIPTVWDESFEGQFSKIDTAFPGIIKWLETLPFDDRPNARTSLERFVPAPQAWTQLNLLIEAILSLIVRSPRLRRLVQGTTEYYRTRMRLADPSADKSLINVNLKHAMGRFYSAAKSRGKFAILRSFKREFIFGDGFLHSYASTANAPMTPEVLVPLTPELAVLWIIPMVYAPNPNLSTLCLSPEEVDVINHTVLVHSRDFVFYRSEPPQLIEAFKQRAHLVYEWPGHPSVQALITALTQLR